MDGDHMRCHIILRHTCIRRPMLRTSNMHINTGPPQHYQPNPYQQPWYPYQHMSMPMPRPYPPYSPMMSAPYPMQHQTSPLHHRPHPPPPTPSSPAVRSQPHVISPASPNPSLHSTFNTTFAEPGPKLAPQTPLPPTPSVLGPPNQRIPYYPPVSFRMI